MEYLNIEATVNITWAQVNCNESYEVLEKLKLQRNETKLLIFVVDRNNKNRIKEAITSPFSLLEKTIEQELERI